MRKRVPWVMGGLAAVAAWSCNPGETPGAGVTELEQYCAVAARADLVSWVGDVVTFCEQGEMDHHGACSAGRVIDGIVEPIDLGGLRIQLALPASGGRLVLLLEDHRLVLTDGRGAIQRELDRWAADPAVTPDGERVAWLGLPDGADADDVGLGTPRVVAEMSLTDAARTVLVEDAMASSPRPIPGTREVLYVSANEEGVAGFFLVGPERGATQVTNVGAVEVDDQFDPVAGAAATWAPDGALWYSVTGLESVETPIDDPDAEPLPDDELENGELVDDAEIEVPHLFRLVLSDDVARVEELGEGGWPYLANDGRILAVLPSGSAPCATTYAMEGTP